MWNVELWPGKAVEFLCFIKFRIFLNAANQ